MTSEASKKLEAFNPSIHQFIETEMFVLLYEVWREPLRNGVHWIVNEKLNLMKTKINIFFNPTKMKPVN